MTPSCKKCGGSMSPNPNKTNEKSPDWICNQDNGTCVTAGKNGKFYASAQWNPQNPAPKAASKSQNAPQSTQLPGAKEDAIAKAVALKAAVDFEKGRPDSSKEEVILTAVAFLNWLTSPEL